MNIVEELEKLSKEGFAPNLLNDDNGNWAFLDEGWQNVRQDGESLLTTLAGEPQWFKQTISEAFEDYLQRIGKT